MILMSLRDYIFNLESQNGLLKVAVPISTEYEIAGLLKELEPTPLLFEQVLDSPFRVIGNLFCNKAAFAGYFGIQVHEIIPFMMAAIERRSPCPLVEAAPCQEVALLEPDLDQLPILRHCERDGGRYISSGVVIARHPGYGQNVDFHRCMQITQSEMAMRVVRGRQLITCNKMNFSKDN